MFPGEPNCFRRRRASSVESLESRLLLAADVSAADDYVDEIGDDVCIVELGQVVTGELTGRNDVDVVAFNAVAGDFYRFYPKNGERYRVVVMGPDGEQRVLSTAGTALPGQPWKAKTSGRHFLKITSTDFFATFSFAVEVDSVNKNPQSAIPIASHAEGNITHAFERDWFRFDTTVGLAYELTVGQLEHAHLEVYDSDGLTRIAIDDDGSTARVVFLAESTGTKYASVRAAHTHLGPYVLVLRDLRNETFVPPGDHVTGLDLGAPQYLLPETVQGEIEAEDDVDSYTFQAYTGGHFYRIETSLLTLSGTRIELLDENDIPLLADTDGGDGFASELNWRPAKSGVYRISVTGQSGTGRYQLSVSAEPDDHAEDFGQATPLIMGELTVGRTQFPGDNESFSAAVEAGVHYEFESIGRPFVLLAPDGLHGPSTSLAWEAETTGTVQLMVRESGAEDLGQYQIRFGLVPDDHLNAPGNTSVILQADGPAASGVLEYPGDVDVFAFDLDADETIMYKSTGNTSIRFLDAQGLPLPTSLEFWQSETGGRYYVEVSDYRWNPRWPTEYTVGIVAIEDDYHDYLSSGNIPVISFGDVISGDLESSIDADLFAFDVKAGQDLETFVVQGSHRTLRVLDPQGNVISPNRFRATLAGRYHVRVQGTKGSYQIQVDQVPDDHPDADWSLASVLVPGEMQTGVFGWAGDQDLFLIDVVAGEKIEVRATWEPTYRPGVIQFQDAKGQVVANGVWIPTQSGRYAVVVAASTGSRGYSLSMFAGDDYPDQPIAPNVPMITSGQPIEGEIEFTEDQDVFAVDLVDGDEVFIESHGGTLSGRILELISDNGDTLERIGDPNFSRQTWEIAESKRYFLRVKPRFYGHLGDYAFTLAWIDDHVNQPQDDATLIGIDDSVEFHIEKPHDVDVFAIEMEAGTVVQFGINSATGQPLLQKLYGPDGRALAATGNPLVWKAYDTGRYHLEVSLSNSETDDLLLVTQQLSVTDDLADHPAASTPILTTGTPVTGIIEVESDRDVWAFDAQEGESFSFTVRSIDIGSSFNSRVFRVLDEAGNVLGGSEGYFAAATSGRYFVEFTSLVDTGEYELLSRSQIDDYPNTISPEAVNLVRDQEASGVMETPNDVDVFRFTVAKDEVISTTRPNWGSFLFGTIYDADGQLIISELLHELHWKAKEAGDYYLAVSIRKGQAFLDYSFPFSTSFDTVTDTIQDAPTISLGIPVFGRSEISYDVDMYAVTVERGVGYRIVSNFDGRINVRNEDGEDFIRVFDPYVSWKSDVSGTVFVGVASFKNGFDYEFTVSQVDDDFPDAIGDDVLFLDPGSTQLGQFEVGQDFDVFGISATKGDGFQFNVTTSVRGLGIQGLRIRTAEGEVISECSCNAWSWKAIADGNYFLELKGPARAVKNPIDYELKLSEPIVQDDYPDEVSTAARLFTTTETIQGIHEVRDDIDVFSFEAKLGEVYQFAQSGNVTTSRLHTIYAATDETQREFTRLFQQEGRSIVWKATATARYYLAVTGLWTGSYTINSDVIEIDDHQDVIGVDEEIAITSGRLRGAIQASNDVDLFPIDLEAGQVIQLATTSNRENQFAIAIRDAEGETVSSNPFGETAWKVTQSGRYYLVISRLTSHLIRATYNVRVKVLDTDLQSSLPTPDAHRLVLGQPVSASIEYDNDADVFQFDAAANRTYAIEVDRSSLASNSTIKMLSVVGDQVSVLDSYSGSRLSWTAPAAGSYFVSVSSSLPVDYQLRVVESDPVANAVDDLFGGSLVGDIDGNGATEFADFLLLSSVFGQTNFEHRADLNGDGNVDFQDFLLLSRNFGATD